MSVEKRRFRSTIVSLVAVATLLPGLAFAIPDAGEQLNAWYQGQFGLATQAIDSQVNTALDTEFNVNVQKHTTDLISGANTIIQKAADNTKWCAIGSIMIHGGNYIEQVRKKSNEMVGSAQVQGTIGRDFNQFITEQKEDISEDISQHAIELMQGFNQELDQIISDATSSMNQASASGQQDLQNAITDAKQLISSNLQSNQSNAISSTKLYLDDELDKLKISLEQSAERLQNESISTLQNTGLEIQNQANVEMELLVNLINNK